MQETPALNTKKLELRGEIWFDPEWRPDYTSEQFLKEAGTYHAAYFKPATWTAAVQRALTISGIEPAAVKHVFDVGSGSGNTVFAALELLPNAHIAANDISPDLLAILWSMLKDKPERERLSLYCFDLHKQFFKPDSFDLCIGGAILHHLMDPKAAIEAMSETIRPGGHLLFFEPLEPGTHIAAAMMHLLLDDLSDEGEAAEPVRLRLRAMLTDYTARFGTGNEKPWSKYLDDKWMFSGDYLRAIAKELGLKVAAVHPITLNGIGTFSGTLAQAGVTPEVCPNLPGRFWRTVELFEHELGALQGRLSVEGIIVFGK